MNNGVGIAWGSWAWWVEGGKGRKRGTALCSQAGCCWCWALGHLARDVGTGGLLRQAVAWENLERIWSLSPDKPFRWKSSLTASIDRPKSWLLWGLQESPGWGKFVIRHLPAGSVDLWGQGSEKEHGLLPPVLSGTKLSPSSCSDARHLQFLPVYYWWLPSCYPWYTSVEVSLSPCVGSLRGTAWEFSNFFQLNCCWILQPEL